MKGSDRMYVLTESQTLALTKDVRRLTAAGKDVLGLTLGEPDFDTPDHIREAAIQAINDGFTHYTPVAGIPDLREGIAAKLREHNNIPVQAENIVVSTGAKQSLVNSIMALVNPGEEVILVAPYWVSYLEMLKMAEAKVVILQTDVEHDFKVSAEKLQAAITDKTRMIIINSPSNPTGAMYKEEEIREIAGVILKKEGMYLIADEIYEHITYGEKHFSWASIPELFPRTVTVNGFSKGYAMTGWRLGYVAAPTWIAQLCEKFQGQVTSGANSIAQKAGVAGITGPLDETYKMTAAFKKRRDFVADALGKIQGVNFSMPTGAFYFYPDLSAFFGKKTPQGEEIKDIDGLCQYLLHEGGLALIPGTAFGTDKHVRISYAYSLDMLENAMDRLAKSLNALS